MLSQAYEDHLTWIRTLVLGARDVLGNLRCEVCEEPIGFNVPRSIYVSHALEGNACGSTASSLP